MPVEEARQGTRVKPDHFYIIPPGKNMLIEKGALRLSKRVGGEGRLVSIDTFLRSLAEDQKDRSIGIILSGNASDGVSGLEAIKGEGGITFAQDEKSAKHSSMPHGAIMSGAADHVLTPGDIARELGRVSLHPYIAPVRVIAQDAALFGEKEQEPLQKIFSMLRTKTGVNFFQYKLPTLKRRIRRRMVLHKFDTLPDYVAYLQSTPGEVDALSQEMLINVTQFFRDAETFDFLKKNVLPQILREHAKDEPIRIWSAGCATGEEAYSLAIILVEFLESHKRHIPFQIFGSDISEANIAKARAGLYSKSIASDVSEKRLRRFFTQMNGSYQISKSIRDMCVFAKQDIISDPPFSQLDLISCRNVLIYLEPVAQKHILPLFQYALKPSGFLVLGKSEGVGEFTDLYMAKHKKHKIYAKKLSAHNRYLRPFSGDASRAYTFTPHLQEKNAVSKSPQPTSDDLDLMISKDVDRLLLSKEIVTPSVVVDDEMHIVQFRGDLSPYLNLPAGKATWNLLKMARDRPHGVAERHYGREKENAHRRAQGYGADPSGSAQSCGDKRAVFSRHDAARGGCA